MVDNVVATRHFRRSRIGPTVMMIAAATNPNVVVVPATNPNVVVVPTPDPPAIHANYASRSSHVLGGIQIAVGTVLIIANIVVISTYGTYWETGGLINHFGAGVTVSVLCKRWCANAPSQCLTGKAFREWLACQRNDVPFVLTLQLRAI